MGCWEFKSEALQLTPKTSKMFQVCITGRERLPADSALLFACEIKVKVFNMCGSKKRGEKRYLKLRMDRSRIFQLLYNVVIMASAQYQSYSQPSTALFKLLVLVGCFILLSYSCTRFSSSWCHSVSLWVQNGAEFLSNWQEHVILKTFQNGHNMNESQKDRQR